MLSNKTSPSRVGELSLPSFDRQTGPEVIERAAIVITSVALLWLIVAAGSTLIGWSVSSTALIFFPAPEAAGTMMPATAAGLLLCTAALWLLRDEKRAHGNRRLVACLLAAAPAFFGALFLWEYASASDLGIDLMLFPQVATALINHLPGRPKVTTNTSFIIYALAFWFLDARGRRSRRASEILLLTISFASMVRLISFVFDEAGVYAPSWRLLGDPILIPMSPKTSTCFLALAVGTLFARPERGLIGLLLSRRAAGTMARWLLPLCILLPIALGWLGMLAIRAELQGSTYPLSLLLGALIVLLILVISLNARTINRLDFQRSQRERLLRAVFDNAGAGLALVDRNGRPIVTNSLLQSMLGYSSDELSTIPFTRLAHSADAGSDQELFDEMVAGKRDSYSIEKRYVRKDGRVFWGQLNASISRGDQNEPEFLIGMVQDVSERKEAEAALARFKAVLDATPDFVGMADTESRATYVNRAGRELTGIGDDLAGITIPDFHPTDVGRWLVQDALPVALKEGVWTGESELQGAKGRRIPVSQVILAHRAEDTNAPYFSTIMRDITEHKQYEDAQQFLLDASRAFSGSLEIDSVLLSIAELTVPTRADYCAVDLIGPDGRIERSFAAHSDSGRTRAVVQPAVEGTTQEPDPVTGEVIRSGEAQLIRLVTDPNLIARASRGRRLQAEEVVDLSMMIIPLRARERVTGIITLALSRPGRRFHSYDLALAGEMAGRAALALDNARLFQSSRESTHLRDEVLRVVAHDLRNPLNTISLSCDLVRELGDTDPASRQKQLDVITRSVSYADGLIQDLLDVARAQAGKLALEARPAAPAPLLREAIELQRSAAAKRDIQLQLDIPEELAPIYADGRRVQQVLANLIGNAIKFSPEGSTVTCRAAEEADSLRISVEDHGCGLSESQIHHLFDPFWQANKSSGGAGLGLPIAKGIVDAHGGRIWVDSKPGRGSTFTFTVPLAHGSSGSMDSLAAD